jgi:L,D-transpeptidase catalytic domain
MASEPGPSIHRRAALVVCLAVACTAEAGVRVPAAAVALAEPPGSVAVTAPAAAPPVVPPLAVHGPPVEPVAPAEPVDAAAASGCIAALEELPEYAALPTEERPPHDATLVVVRKAERRLIVFEGGDAAHCFVVALGFAPLGHKRLQGDGKTPEGYYRTSDKPWSSFDNAIAIHYPNEADARAAAADRRIGAKTRNRIIADVRAGRVPPQSTTLGGAVLIHGGGSGSDWTLGCIALDDADLVTLRAALPRGMRADLWVLP